MNFKKKGDPSILIIYIFYTGKKYIFKWKFLI